MKKLTFLTVLTLLLPNLAHGQGMGSDYRVLQVRLDMGNIQQGDTVRYALPKSQWACQATNQDNVNGLVICYLRKDHNVFVSTNVVCAKSTDGDFLVINESARYGYMIELGCQ